MTERGSTTTSLYYGLGIPTLDDDEGGAATLAELARAIDRPEAGLVLVSARKLRWIVRYHLDLRYVFSPVPHARSYTFPQEVLADLLRYYGISLRSDPGWLSRAPAHVTLLARPSRRELARHGLPYFVREAWGHRLAGLVRFQVAGSGLRTSIREQRAWIARLGEARFEEARDVLDGEQLLVDPADDGEVVRELAALFYRLRFFDPVRLKALLPSLQDDGMRRGLDGMLRAAGVDPEALLDSSRPPGADSPAQVVASADRREAASRERARKYHDRDHRLGRLLAVALGDATTVPLAARGPLTTLAGLATARLIEADGRLGRLDFAGLRNAAIAHGLEIGREPLLELDRALALEFPERYRRIGRWQRVILALRGPGSVAYDRVNARRAQATIRSLEWIELELDGLSRPIRRWRLAIRRVTWVLGQFLGAGLVEMACRASEIASPMVQAAADYFRRARLRFLLDGARLSEDRHAAHTLVLLQRARRAVAPVINRDLGSLARAVDRRMHLEYDLRSQPFALRLSARLGLAPGEHEQVRRVIDYLARETSAGGHGVAAELLLDLESSYLAGQRSEHAWNLRDWALSLGAHPARIALPHAAELARLSHLRRAIDRAERLTLPDEMVAARIAPIRDLERRTAAGLRSSLALEVTGAMDAVLPHELAGARERFARETIEASLVRLMVERGHSHASDVRDVMSRNQLKLDDLAWRELVRGDLLSRLDRELARRLPGVHHAGELYLGAFQLLAAIAFGTLAGRLFCKLVLFPTAVATLALMILQLTVGKLLGWSPLLENTELVLRACATVSVVANIRPLRRVTVFALWRLPRRLLSGFVALVARTPRPVRTWVLYPATSGLAVATYLGAHGAELEHALGVPAGMAFARTARFTLGVVLAAATINTRVGVALAGIAAGFYRLAVDEIGRGLFMRLYHLILGVSRGLVELLERFDHVVVRALRLVEGEGRAACWAKAALGLAWAPVYYVFRAYVLLFLEPQVNPLKFPAVSVSYKLMLPIYDTMALTIATWGAVILPAAVATWGARAFTFFFCGIFGFLAWELKENWRLYRRNASATVKASPIGSHGETVAELLRPGFHSGPLPRLYRARRRALADDPHSERARAALRLLNVERDRIHAAIARLVEDELVRPLARHIAFAGARVELDPASVRTTGHAIGFTIRVDVITLVVELEERRGVLAASIRGPVALLARLQQHVLALQFAFFCELASVDASRNAVELLLAREAVGAGQALYDIEPGRLVIHADEGRPKSFRGRLSALWPSRGKRAIDLPDPYWLREHELAWATYDALHDSGGEAFALGSKYLPLLGLVPTEGLVVPTIGEPEATQPVANEAAPPSDAAPPVTASIVAEAPPPIVPDSSEPPASA